MSHPRTQATWILAVLSLWGCKAQRSDLAVDAELEAVLGRPRSGYQYLVNADYMGCGVPMSILEKPGTFAGVLPQSLKDYLAPALTPGPYAEAGMTRDASQRGLPYFMTAFTLPDGTRVANMNCLGCHGETVAGKVVVGLGNVTRDFTGDLSAIASARVEPLLMTEGERAAWKQWANVMKTLAPAMRTQVVGANPAVTLTAATIAHLDDQTLTRRDTPALTPPSGFVPPVDVPPWWRLKHRRTLFYNAAFHGDHRRYVMLASAQCLRGREAAQAIERMFFDVDAFISAIDAPRYPHALNEALVQSGKGLFETHCASCHGRYENGAVEYDESVVALADIGTDPELARLRTEGSERFAAWVNRSWFGELGQYRASSGYVAPPLNGIWATAPFFHNGSVPTLEGVLDSKKRPKAWRRPSVLSDYDQDAGGWRVTAPTSSGARSEVYDTTRRGHAASGHRYGDGLKASERRALVEYLKTL